MSPPPVVIPYCGGPSVVYNPYGCIYHGSDFQIQPGESILVIPSLTNGNYYTSYAIKFTASNTLLQKNKPAILCLLITNQYVDTAVLVKSESYLCTLLDSCGIDHVLGYCSYSDVLKINN